MYTMTDSPSLLDLVSSKIRLKHYSIRTEEAYKNWEREVRGRAFVEYRETPQ